ncbi:MAG: hypothetical protein WBP79_00590 [Candidatus Acidiferrales bacterium]
MDNYLEKRYLRMLEGYLADMICDSTDLNEMDLLSQALASVQRALMPLEKDSAYAPRANRLL